MYSQLFYVEKQKHLEPIDYSPDINFQEIKEFAEKVALKRKKIHEQRNQSNLEKTTRDNFLGKLAEFGVRDFIRSQFNLETTEPDLTIYNDRENLKKGHDPDLIAGNLKIHVKSCEYRSYFGESYSWQPNCHHIADPSPNDYICCVQNYELGYSVRYFGRAVDINHLLKNPIKEDLIGLKAVLYADDLIAA